MGILKERFNWIKFLVVASSFTFCFQIIDAASTKGNPQVCQSESCKTIASSILHKMNQSVNPCDNFYEFVCGNFTRNAVIPDSRSDVHPVRQLQDVLVSQLRNSIENQITDKDPEALQKLLMYYKTCMNEDQIEKTSRSELLEILNSLGGWPVLLGKSYRDSDFDWKVALNKIGKLGYYNSYFLTMQISKDLKNNTLKVIYLDQAKLGTSQEYLSQGLENDVVKAYFKYMVDVAEIFGANREQAKLDLGESLNFEIELAKISLSKVKRRNSEKLYNPMKISELQSKYPYINWLQYLNDQLSESQRLTEDVVVIVLVPSFFGKLGELVARTPKRVLANYALWRVTDDSADMLEQKVCDAKREFKAALTGNRNKNPRWLTCVTTASSYLSLATSALYVRRNFGRAAKDEVMNMIQHLRQSFKNILLEVDWMDETTRKAALQKLEQMIPLVGYSEELLDDEKINDYYKDFKVFPKSYLKTILALHQFKDAKLLNTYRTLNPRVDWKKQASDVVNAFYSPSANTIKFPAGILQGDFYNKNYPNYVNYAAIGSIIGHEMTHGFDDNGSGYDGIGNLVNWWQADTKKEYLKRAQCIIDQYSSYTDPQTNLKINGNLTQDENIADNGGLKEAYMAYTAFETENGVEPSLPGFENFTSRQLFWISYGNIWCIKYRTEYLADLIKTDTHTPTHFRMIGTVTNNVDFAKDFNCPVGCPMNPPKKCSVW